MLNANNITKTYGALQVLRGVDITVSHGEVVAIMGPSGAGKSTLLHILAALDKPDEGCLSIGNVDLLALSDSEIAAFRNQHIGFIFQAYHLLPEFTALENVCMPGYIAGDDRHTVERRGQELLALLHLQSRALHKPNMLSGGEQQRIAIARALLNNPQVVFADEPSGSLDTQNAAEIHALFLELRDTLGQTFVFATHNRAFADMADKIFMMKDGRITEVIS